MVDILETRELKGGGIEVVLANESPAPTMIRSTSPAALPDHCASCMGPATVKVTARAEGNLDDADDSVPCRVEMPVPYCRRCRRRDTLRMVGLALPALLLALPALALAFYLVMEKEGTWWNVLGAFIALLGFGSMLWIGPTLGHPASAGCAVQVSLAGKIVLTFQNREYGEAFAEANRDGGAFPWLSG